MQRRKWMAWAGVLCLVGIVLVIMTWRLDHDNASHRLLADSSDFLARLNASTIHANAVPLKVEHLVYSLHQNIGSLRIDRLHLSVPVVEGADDAGLKLGAAHVLGTGYPGTQTNCAVAAHRDTLFRSLKDIRKGDVITFTTSRSTFAYQVTGMEIISPENTRVLSSRGTPEMTLVTCYPFYFVGHAPKRYIVHATLNRS